MEGVGAVFRAYRDGELTADDEVAVAHGDEPGVFRPFSEALVNIRATLDAAVLSGVLEPPARDQLVEIAQSLFYPSRAWPTIIDRARCDGLEEEALHDFESWLPGNAVDLKREDALALLDRMQELIADPFTPKQISFHLEDTSHWCGLNMTPAALHR